MNWMLSLDMKPLEPQVNYNRAVLLMGSCFSENMGRKLAEAKFKAVYNPTGIVFDPLSVARHLTDIATGKQYTRTDLFHHNELWHSWNHHSVFSSMDPEQTLASINKSITETRALLQQASHVFITLGTAYQYKLTETGQAVANNHKAPGHWFTKHLLSIEEMTIALQEAIQLLKQNFPELHVVVTVSPVKHIRDGIVENSLSKARLLEVAHQLEDVMYFPSYELVTDVLRDYRFYAPDMAHPNEQATQFVFDQFCEVWMSPETRFLMGEVKQVVMARRHTILHPHTKAHQQFKATMLTKIQALQTSLPMLNWDEELGYFKALDAGGSH